MGICIKIKFLLLICFILLTLSTEQNLKFLDDSIKTFSSTLKDDVQVIKASVRYHHQKGTYKLIYEYDTEAPAYATLTKSLTQKGWDFLALSSYQGDQEKYMDDTKAYAMGFLEGSITSERIWAHYLNMKTYSYADSNGKMTDNTREYLERNYEWMKIQAVTNKNSDDYWYHVYTIIRQMEGLLDGYNSNVDENRKISYAEFQVMNAAGDFSEINYWNSTHTRPTFHKMTTEQIYDFVEANSHCSALMKVSSDFSDVWFGHNTWTTFTSMIRIFKEYRFKSNKKSEKSKTVAFSGYPGTLSSIDDFYINDKDLYITETTNQVFKTELFDKLTPESLLTWMRTMIANRLSDNSKTWTEIFAKFNSGTYNNQFQILDLKLIDTENKSISDNALWIIEQIPGFTQSADVSNILRYGFWPSYNSAYFKDIRAISGYDEQLKNKPELKDAIDYDGCARANIFRRDQYKVNSLEDFKKILRYNNYQKDPLSKNNPTFAIACRKDLADNPECRGATDAKIASIKDLKGLSKKKINMISGPTNDIQETFDSSTAKCAAKQKYVFNGLPQKFEFSWVEYTTTLFE